MMLFSDEAMKVLTELRVIIDVRKDHGEELEKMVRNNSREDHRKRGTTGSRVRSEDTVILNTAQGLGAEMALIGTGLFEASAPIVDDPMTIKFSDRMVDLRRENIGIQVKTMQRKYGEYVASQKVMDSILHSAPHNGVFLVMDYKHLGGCVFDYMARFLVAADKFASHFAPAQMEFSNWKFIHERAIRRGDCIDFQDRRDTT